MLNKLPYFKAFNILIIGDSRAILCRNGKVLPLTSDHKADR